MPLYEDKIISPLALRFSQQRIRETFQDARQVEATINEISIGPGVGDYDIVLQAPFPTIEIVRYATNGRGSHGDDDHWFTFDNRRLYCLQRVAAEHWPKHVGVTVEVLYADAGAIRKKLDTSTCGLCVSIGHAFASAEELQSWDWRQSVEERSPPGLPMAEKAEAFVRADDAKTSVSELTSAPGAESSLDRLARHLAASELVVPAAESKDSNSNHETVSTAHTESPNGSQTPPPEPMIKKYSGPEARLENLSGVWLGGKGETYTVSWKAGQWHCVREDNYAKKFSIQQDDEAQVLWWGIQGTYYANQTDLTENSDELRWYGASDKPGRRPRFAWHKVSREWAQDEEPWQAEVPWKQQAWPQKKGKTKPKHPHQQQQQATSRPPAASTKVQPKWVAVANSGGA